jgi:pilus assembly protein Flp/PilA
MSKVLGGIKRFVREEEGATMVEYALMLALIAIVCIAAVAVIGTNAKTVFTNAAGSLTAAS